MGTFFETQCRKKIGEKFTITGAIATGVALIIEAIVYVDDVRAKNTTSTCRAPAKNTKYRELGA